jgi:hypothetical protein
MKMLLLLSAGEGLPSGPAHCKGLFSYGMPTDSRGPVRVTVGSEAGIQLTTTTGDAEARGTKSSISERSHSIDGIESFREILTESL